MDISLPLLRLHPLSPRSIVLLAVSIVCTVVVGEILYSPIQSTLLSVLNKALKVEIDPGSSSSIVFPQAGPHDLELGYSLIPAWTSRMNQRGYHVTEQARFPSVLRAWTEWGFYPPYHEKASAGLEIVDTTGRLVERLRFPGQRFSSLDEIPTLVVQTLLFIEDRHVLDATRSRLNPAVEWSRFAKAAVSYVHKKLIVRGEGRSFGGSTLATQLEKFRHSPGGRTSSASDKLVQVISASTRAYLAGPNSWERRQQIVLDYINTMPLAAVSGVGPVNGLGDGLRFWFGEDPAVVMRALASFSTDIDKNLDNHPSEAQAIAYRSVLGLFIATRRPATYLRSGGSQLLDQQVDRYLRAMANEGVITQALRDAAIAARAPLRPGVAQGMKLGSQAGGDLDALHAHLLSLLGAPRVYDLLRYDASVETSLNIEVTNSVQRYFESLAQPEVVSALGLRGERLLGSGDLNRVRYSLMLMERHNGANLVRVQADNVPGPFNPNELMKLELGSTAKLRTLVTYLEVIAEIHARWSPWNSADLRNLDVWDPLSRWVIEKLTVKPGLSLSELLAEAMNRTYSASPAEGFYTGGGLHRFANFDKRHNGMMLTVSEATQDSVNLVFVRMMRDIVDYHVAWAGMDRLLHNPNHPQRRQYLERFVRREGETFIRRFYTHYRNLDADAIYTRIDTRLQQRSPVAQAAVKAFLFPEQMSSQMALVDVAYLSRIHPLELWVARHLMRNPAAPLQEILVLAQGALFQSYSWLSRAHHAQDLRIRTEVERVAFASIHKRWQRLGFPFPSLVPSLATALGSSGDRPSALADLMGILMQDGVRVPSVRVTRIQLGRDTPYETTLEHQGRSGSRVLPPEVAQVARTALSRVVNMGTARRISGVFVGPAGEPLVAGGKTGTGDNRRKVVDRFGRVREAISNNRTASFVFFVGERHFGVITAYVEGNADDYSFTSALPVVILRSLAPQIQKVIDDGHSWQGVSVN